MSLTKIKVTVTEFFGHLGAVVVGFESKTDILLPNSQPVNLNSSFTHLEDMWQRHHSLM